MLRLIVIAKVTYSPAPALRADHDHARVIWLLRFTQQPLNDLAGHLVDADRCQGVVGAELPASLWPEKLAQQTLGKPCNRNALPMRSQCIGLCQFAHQVRIDCRKY